MEQLEFVFFESKYQGFVFFLLGSVITFAASYLFYILSAKEAKMTYDSKNTLLVDTENLSLPESINLLHSHKVITKLARTYVYIWNCGNRTIRKTDLVESNPLRIEFDNKIEIYSVKILTNTDYTNNFIIDMIKDKSIRLSFDFLEPRNGVKIEILHNDDFIQTCVKGKIIDVKDGVKNSKDLLNSKVNHWFDVFNIVFIYFVVWAVSFSVFALLVVVYTKIYKNDWIVIIGMFIYSILPAIIIPHILKRFNKSKNYPSRLDK